MTRVRPNDRPVGHCKHRKLTYCPSCAAELPPIHNDERAPQVGAPPKTVRNLKLAADVGEVQRAVRALSQKITQDAKNALSSTWWAERTIDFTDPLLEPGCFFDCWLRSLGLRVDSVWTSGAGRPPAPGSAEGLREPLLTEFKRRTIRRAEDVADAEIKDDLSPLDSLKTDRAKATGLEQRSAKHNERLKRRRHQIIRALMGKAPRWPEGYWAFALAAAAMWRRVPALSYDDFVHPPELIAHTLVGWRYGLEATSVPKTLDRLHQLVVQFGGQGWGPFDYDPIDQQE